MKKVYSKTKKTSSITRIQRWKKPEFIDIPFTTDGNFTKEDNALCHQITERQKRFSNNVGTSTLRWNTQSGIMRASRELVFDIVDEKPVFHVITYTFNVRRGQLELAYSLDILISGETEEEKDEDIRNTLAIAYINDTPVLPNRDNLAETLAKHYRKLMVQGFSAPDGRGGRIRLALTKSPGTKIDSIDFLKGMNLSEARQPAEIALIREAVNRELYKLSEANRLLGALEVAINDLGSLLGGSKRNESELQSCLTRNPILFGLEYRKVIPKHCLGSEFEMDYALERFSGMVDLVEIESSTFPLFTKKGDPSQYLIHAEQQVFDWLHWVERNHPYAREKLSRIMRPLGFVVIGSDSNLGNGGKEKLFQRNTMLRDALQILTYDDLLKKAKNILSVLSGVETLRSHET